MAGLEDELDALAAETGFSGVVRVEGSDGVEFESAWGLAHRGYGIPNTVDTRFATASGTKGLTALAVVSLIEEGRLELATTARSVLGRDLPLIDDEVTVEQLLAHRSGIGDYLDEEDEISTSPTTCCRSRCRSSRHRAVPRGARWIPDEVPAWRTLRLLQRRLRRAGADRRAGERGAVHMLVQPRVCERAGMADTEFLRSDELPRRTALGYLESRGVANERVPPAGAGHRRRRHVHDRRRRQCLLERLLRRPDRVAGWVREMARPRSDTTEGMRCGLGFWLHASTDAVMLDG